MECPHCDEQIDTVTRTGDKRFSCGNCNMVISFDEVSPHLDDLNVIDKRGAEDDGEDESTTQDSGAEPDVELTEDTSNDMSGTPEHGLNDREKIYQRGREGLKEIKKERLKNWLSHTEGVGSQTESRVLMVFERNETIHQNPHILYNLLDDELSASPSYINTMVEDIFSPERENEDLLQSQGYTPWYRRNNMANQQQMGGGGGQAFNATGGSPQGFSGGGGQQSQGQQGQQPQGQQGQQNAGSTNGGSDDSITAEEAAAMVERGIAQAEQQRGSNPVREGLSDATDEALKEMATNIGGLAGTMQRVIDEALVQYARENPEWVIENMGVLQKVIGATEEASGGGGGNEPKQAESDAAVDDALSDLGGGGGQPQQSSPQQQQQTQQQPSGGGLDDLSFDESGESGFSPSEETQEAAQSEPPATETEPESEPTVEEEPPEPKPTPGAGAAQESQQRREQFETEEDNEQQNAQQNQESEDEFDDIFGDIAE